MIKEIEDVEHFIYPGSMVNKVGGSDEDVNKAEWKKALRETQTLRAWL